MRDDCEHLLNSAIALNAPQQKFLNQCFRAEKLSRQVIESACSTSANLASDDVLFRTQYESREEARRANEDVISGSSGRRVVTELSTLLFNLGDVVWGAVAHSRARRFESARLVICGIASVWKRLVWDVEQQPKLKVIASCARE